MKTKALWILILSVFWIMMVGRVEAQQFWAGLIAGSIIVWLSQGFIFSGSEIIGVHRLHMWLRYFGLFLIELVKANLAVAWIVLQRNPPISPVIVRFPAPVKTELGLTALANSITLTPGTLTVRISDCEVIVHALTESMGRSCGRGVLINSLVDIEMGGGHRG